MNLEIPEIDVEAIQASAEALRGAEQAHAHNVGLAEATIGLVNLRDDFAAAALEGMLQHPHAVDPRSQAALAYQYADAMLFARAPRKTEQSNYETLRSRVKELLASLRERRDEENTDSISIQYLLRRITEMLEE